ncbi:hypothetical protein [Paenibacillus alginolyticus]|nr:hypothetical protein [Paenibacillus alginolyticus]MEC0143059.1 hypothetical protein [Paenibacillus alginolyticus]
MVLLKASAWMQKVQSGRQSENRTGPNQRTLFIMAAEWRGNLLDWIASS